MKATNLILASLLLGSLSATANSNYSDDLDQNTMPAPLEERQNEEINSGDYVDRNVTPSAMEERQQEEELESDMIQTDDPEKTYDPIDSEFDE